MAHVKLPVAIWQDEAKIYHASLLSWSAPIAFSGSRRAALEELKDYLAWQLGDQGIDSYETMNEPALHMIKVLIRPEYTLDQKRMPLPNAIPVVIPCIAGRMGYGTNMAVIPTLDQRVEYYRDSELNNLVRFVVERQLHGLTPQQLTPFLKSPKFELDVVRIRSKEIKFRDDNQVRPILKQVSDSLSSKQVRSLYGQAWKRESLVASLLPRLDSERANLLLVGEHGVGKTTVLVDAIRKLRVYRKLRKTGSARETYPANESAEDDYGVSQRHWQTSGSRLIAGMKYLGQWEQRVEAVISALDEVGGCLCVESLSDLLASGGSDAKSSVASFCLPYLQRRELQMVVEATPAELDACQRLLPGFVDQFEIVDIEPLDPATTSAILKDQGITFQKTFNVEFDQQSASELVSLYQRFLPYLPLPGNASRFFQQLCNETRTQLNRLRSASIDSNSSIPNIDRPTITPQKIQERFSQQTGIDSRFIKPQVSLTANAISSEFEKDVIGQPDACRVVTQVVQRFKASLSDPQRPLGVLLFCGPTGVGKTELAKSLSRYLFGALPATAEKQSQLKLNSTVPESLIRLDMSEFSAPWSAERLVQQSDGEPSRLIRHLRQRPFSVVLLDEIEKAHHDVFDVLLNVFDEGRLMDAFGRITYFRSAVIIMTSNLGVTKASPLGFLDTKSLDQRHAYESAVKKFFRLEFYNRFDQVVPFNSLSDDVVRLITEKELVQLTKREGFVRLGLTLQWSEQAVEYLARAGFDPQFGARPLQRLLETKVVTPLAKRIGNREIKKGSTVRLVIDDNDELAFGKE